MSWLSGAISGVASLLGGGISAITGKQAGDREYARQQEFAQNGIRWRVEDAKAAGIHPIFGVGANIPTYSPQAAVGSDFGLSNFGQNIGRAIEAKQTHEERMAGQRLNNMVGQAQARYYEAAANNQQAQADLAGQRAVAEALTDISRGGFLGDMELSSRNRLRNQAGQPPVMPRTDVNKGFDKPTPRYDFEFGLNGQRVAVAHSQTMHDKYEDMFLAEYWPVALGMVADARFKLTREPVMAEDGKWYAYNGSYYAPINIRTYRREWEASVINRARSRFHGKSFPYRAGAGVNSHAGGGGV